MFQGSSRLGSFKPGGLFRGFVRYDYLRPAADWRSHSHLIISAPGAGSGSLGCSWAGPSFDVNLLLHSFASVSRRHFGSSIRLAIGTQSAAAATD